VKNKREKDKIRTKPDKNEKRGEVGKSQKQLQSREQEKLKKMQVEGPKMQIPTKLLKKEERKGLELQFTQRAARQWLEKEPSRSITTWEDLVSKYKDLLRAYPHHGFTELHQLNTFYHALNPTDQDSLNAAAGGNLLERSTQDVLTIIENKLKVRNSRSKSIASQVKACDTNSSSEVSKLTHVVNEQTSAVTTAMTAMLRQFQATPPPAPVKAVEETYCLAVDGNTFPEFRDNIQEYGSAAAANYN
nr:hypothetical protein [Tanacetum cinerariifolium]